PVVGGGGAQARRSETCPVAVVAQTRPLVEEVATQRQVDDLDAMMSATVNRSPRSQGPSPKPSSRAGAAARNPSDGSSSGSSARLARTQAIAAGSSSVIAKRTNWYKKGRLSSPTGGTSLDSG